MNNVDFKGIFEQTISNDPTKVLYEYYNKGEIVEITYKQLKDKIHGMALELKEGLVGIHEESWIALQADNNPWNMAIIWALLRNNMNVVLVDVESKNTNDIIRHSGAKAIITSKDLFIDGITNIDINKIRLCDYVEYIPSDDKFANKIALCTSGTSGIPKICVHTGKQVSAHIHSVLERYKQTENLKYNTMSKQTKKTMSLFKFHHIASVLPNFMYPYIGGTIVYTDTLRIKTLLDLINKQKVQNVYAVPMIWDSMLKYISGTYGDVEPETIRKVFGDNLKLALMGAAKATIETVEILNKAGIFTTSAYGMTEIGSLTSNIDKNAESRNRGIVGKIGSKFYDFKIKKSDGTLVTTGEGELLVRGDMVYHSQLVDGVEIERNRSEYFCTGDMVKIENCELTILGRVKDVIVNSSGENIYIDQLESKFYGIKDEGMDFTIIGFEDEPVMIVYVADENNLKNIIDKIIEINNSLEIYTRIAKLYISRDNIEKTSTGKIKRNEIAKRIASNDESIELVKL